MRRRLLLLFLTLLLRPWTAPANSGSEQVPNTPTADVNAHSPAEVFAQMRKTFVADKAKGLHLRYQFYFSDPQGGNWWVEVDDGACRMGQGEIPEPNVTFNCTGADWVQLSNGTLGGFHAYITGRLHIQGPQALARKLDELFP